MDSRNDRKRPRTSRSSFAFEVCRKNKDRQFKHTAINEMIDLIEHKHPWKIETRQKVATIAQQVSLQLFFIFILSLLFLLFQVIDDLKPFASAFDPCKKNLSAIIVDLKSVIGIINTATFQVVASHEALSLLKLIKESLKDMDENFTSSSDDETERSKNISRPLSKRHSRMLLDGNAHLHMLNQMNALPSPKHLSRRVSGKKVTKVDKKVKKYSSQ